jgi:hypothetical protein
MSVQAISQISGLVKDIIFDSAAGNGLNSFTLTQREFSHEQ